MQIYTIQNGDSLTSIGAAYGLTPTYLEYTNELTNPDRLVTGQDLIIAPPAALHTVAAGDTLSSIAELYLVPLLTLLRNNPQLSMTDTLVPGSTVIVQFSDEVSTERRPISTIGYTYPNINRDTLKKTLPFLTYLSIFTYGFTTEGELITIDDQELISLARSYGVAPILLFSTLGSSGTFSNELSSALLSNPELQDRLIDNLILTMKEKQYYGLDIDFEYVFSNEREAYVTFVETLTKRCNEEGLTVLVALAPKISADQPGLLYEAHDYQGLGAAANSVLLMTYEWGYTYGPPMAVAPIPSVRRVLDYAITEIPPEKIYMGIPNYGYDWSLPYVRGTTKAKSLGNVAAIELALKTGSDILYDEKAQSPFFYYTDDENVPHVVWFENAHSIEAKLGLVSEYGFLGAGYWNVMRWFPQNWLLANLLFEITTLLPFTITEE